MVLYLDGGAIEPSSDLPSYRPCMANNPAGTKLGAASEGKILT